MADIQVKKALISAPRGTANIFRLKGPTINEQTIRKIARLVGMQADARSGMLCIDADTLTYSEQHLQLTLFRGSGAIRLIDRSRWQIDDRRTDLDIADAEARRLASALIRKNKLAPAAADSRLLKVSRLRVGAATRDGREVSERAIDVGVAFQRMIDKIPVDGPGGKIIVYMDQERRLSGVEKIWRELGAIYRRNQPHRPIEDALKEMDQHFRKKSGIIEIEEIRYGYFEEGWRETQRYIQPAYIIFGMHASHGNASQKRTIYVAPALVNPVGRLTPPLERKPRQRPRPQGR
jgi:hypothetical protein